MKKLSMILPLAVVLCFAFSCQKTEEVTEKPAVDIASEVEAIREVFAAQGKAGPAKDVDLFVSYMTDDVVCAGVGDKEAIREWYSNWFSKGNYWDNGTIEKIEVSASGDMAYTVCSWELFNDEGSRAKNSNVLVWKKQADGTWKCVAY
jgi:ketosteroid isomerase-like protein